MDKTGKTFIYFSVAVSIAAALYFISQNWKNQLVLRHVRVYDARILTDQEVKTIADVRRGSPLFKLSLAKISRRVEQNPFIKEAVVVRALPYDLTITVRERNPIALVATSASILSVDGSGIILPVPLTRKSNLPLITGAIGTLSAGDSAKGALLQAVQFLLDAEKMGPSLSANIAEVRIDSGGLVAYTTALSLPVLVGSGDFHRKLVYLKKFLTDLAPTDGSQCRYVDLRFNGQIVLGLHDAGNDLNGQNASYHAPRMFPATEKSGKVN